MCIYTHTYEYTYMYSINSSVYYDVRESIRINMYMTILSLIHTYIYVYVYMYIHIYTFIHTHIHILISYGCIVHAQDRHVQRRPPRHQLYEVLDMSTDSSPRYHLNDFVPIGVFHIYMMSVGITTLVTATVITNCFAQPFNP